jgi:hypothetical protein
MGHDCGDSGCGSIPRPRKASKQAWQGKNINNAGTAADVHESSDDEPEHDHPHAAKKSVKKGYNLTAVGLLLLFVIPSLFAGFIYVSFSLIVGFISLMTHSLTHSLTRSLTFSD